MIYLTYGRQKCTTDPRPQPMSNMRGGDDDDESGGEEEAVAVVVEVAE